MLTAFPAEMNKAKKAIEQLTAQARTIVNKQEKGALLQDSNYPIYLNRLNSKLVLWEKAAAVIQEFNQGMAKLLKWPNDNKELKTWEVVLQAQRAAVPGLINSLTEQFPNQPFAQYLRDMLNKQWEYYEKASYIIEKMSEHCLPLNFAHPEEYSTQQLQEILPQLTTELPKLTALIDENARNEEQQNYLPDLIESIGEYEKRIAQFEEQSAEIIAAGDKQSAEQQSAPIPESPKQEEPGDNVVIQPYHGIPAQNGPLPRTQYAPMQADIDITSNDQKQSPPPEIDNNLPGHEYMNLSKLPNIEPNENYKTIELRPVEAMIPETRGYQSSPAKPETLSAPQPDANVIDRQADNAKRKALEEAVAEQLEKGKTAQGYGRLNKKIMRIYRQH